MERWQGKVALVTGASSGIGAAIATLFAREGLTVVGVARRFDRLQELQNNLGPAKGSLHVKQFDISKLEEIPKLFEDIKREFGGVDVLVNNAGIVRSRNKLTEATTQDLVDVINTNVLALAVATREAVSDMKSRKTFGHIFNINSIAGHKVPLFWQYNMEIYSPSKYAVTSMTETARFEMGMLGTKIKITSISPGAVRTEIIQNKTEDGNFEEKPELLDLPILVPEDVADAVKYALQTPENVLITELSIRSVDDKFPF